jgi:hypothetical protein
MQSDGEALTAGVPATRAVPTRPGVRRAAAWARFGLWASWVVATVVGGAAGLLVAVIVIPALLSAMFWQVPLDWTWAHPDVHPLLTSLALQKLVNVPSPTLWRAEITHYVFWPYIGAALGGGGGLAQAWVLRRAVPGGKGGFWVGGCVAGMSAGLLLFVPVQFAVLQGEGLFDLYNGALDLLPAAVFDTLPYDLFDADNSLSLYAFGWRLLRAVLLGATCGLIVGGLQWRALKGRLPHAGLWVPIVAAGMSAGGAVLFTLYMISPPADRQGALIFWQAATYLLAGLATVG